MPFNAPSDLWRRLGMVGEAPSDTQITELQAHLDSAYSLMCNYCDRSVLICPSAGIATGTATSVAANTLTDSGASWTTDAYAGYCVVDSSGRAWEILSNTATALTVDAEGQTPASGAYSIDDMLIEEYDPTNGARMYLRAVPIVAVGAIYEDDDVAQDYTTADYVIHSKYGYLRSDSGWGGPDDYWTIIYRGGYRTSDTEYGELSWIEREIAAAMWKRSGVLNISMDQAGIGAPNPEELTADVDVLLERHMAAYRLYGQTWR